MRTVLLALALLAFPLTAQEPNATCPDLNCTTTIHEPDIASDAPVNDDVATFRVVLAEQLAPMQAIMAEQLKLMQEQAAELKALRQELEKLHNCGLDSEQAKAKATVPDTPSAGQPE